MPYDGIVTNKIALELNSLLQGGRIEKVFMPEREEVALAIRTQGGNLRLSIQVNPSMPRVNLTTVKKENPSAPPMFCMFLRKHISGGIIKNVYSHGYERVLIIEIVSTTELGDRTLKKLIVEIMGKHSNIIIVNAADKIMDCIKHVDSGVSSKREVMPARLYEYPPSQDKCPPDEVDKDFLLTAFRNSGLTAEKTVLNCIQGFSPALAKECCFRADMDWKQDLSQLDDTQKKILAFEVMKLIDEIKDNQLDYCVYYNINNKSAPADYHCIKLNHLPHYKEVESLNHALDIFFNSKMSADTISQRKNTLLKVINQNIDRCVKKLELQRESVNQSKNYNETKKYGELLTANLHRFQLGDTEVTVTDYYSDQADEITIPIQINLLPQQNAQKYYKMYNKRKKTFEQASIQMKETLNELEYLESIVAEIENAEELNEISDIRQEIISQEYIKHSVSGKKKKINESVPMRPFKYISTDGIEIYAGKNNKMNDLLTLKSSKPDDIWMHTQKIPGSHVIIKSTHTNVPERTLEEAAYIAAWHSRGKKSAKVPVDFTAVRNVKKPPGAKPGMVTYDKFKTIIVTPEEDKIRKLADDD